MIARMWRLYQRVYLTRDGLELTCPPRVVPWSKVGDAFRYPLSGSLMPICCIGINDAPSWDLLFFGRDDFDRVVQDGRSRWREPRAGSTR
jgi:hypothetical protein